MLIISCIFVCFVILLLSLLNLSLDNKKNLYLFQLSNALPPIQLKEFESS